MSQIYSVGDRVIFTGHTSPVFNGACVPMFHDVRNPNGIFLVEGIITSVTMDDPSYDNERQREQSVGPMRNGCLYVSYTDRAGLQRNVSIGLQCFVDERYTRRVPRNLSQHSVLSAEQTAMLLYYVIPRVVGRSSYIHMLRDLVRAVRGQDVNESVQLADVDEIAAAAEALNLTVLRHNQFADSTVLTEEPDWNSVEPSTETDGYLSAITRAVPSYTGAGWVNMARQMAATSSDETAPTPSAEAAEEWAEEDDSWMDDGEAGDSDEEAA